MKKLSPLMLKALKAICQNPGAHYSFQFKTGEALRKRGLVNRYTTYAVKAVYAQPSAITVQYSVPFKKAHQFHEWDATKLGYQTADGGQS